MVIVCVGPNEQRTPRWAIDQIIDTKHALAASIAVPALRNAFPCQ